MGILYRGYIIAGYVNNCKETIKRKAIFQLVYTLYIQEVYKRENYGYFNSSTS